MIKLNPYKALNPAYRKHKPLPNEVLSFIEQLKECITTIKLSDNNNESEEHIKEPIKKFFQSTFYHENLINTKNNIDLAIYLDKTIKSDVGVIIEAKRSKNKKEFISPDNLNKKAFHELLLYYFRERIDKKNNNIKHLIATNGLEWFFFKAEDFYNIFYKNKNLVKEYEQFRDGLKDTSKNEIFYDEIATKYISSIQTPLPFVHFDFTKTDFDNLDDDELNTYYKIFSDVHLLGHSFGNDSNQLNKNFYNELLHIIGLEEVSVGSKKVIDRKTEKTREYASLLENTIFTLEEGDKLRNVKSIENGSDKSFNVGLELCLTWINRVLFLKLLESQLASYHKGAKEYRFLNSSFIHGYDELNRLFFSALAQKVEERNPRYAEKFKNIPYLNSSLFEHSEIESLTFDISALIDDEMKVYSNTVLKDVKGNKFKGKLTTLDYLFKFLDAYNFANDDKGEISDGQENKTLINASVLGLIFEKINGYKDGSFYTPAYITMYMCRETIRKAVIQKFRELENDTIETFEDLKAYCHRFYKSENIMHFNSIVNSLRICDPAVGSGHFLVSALNELICIKNELGILVDDERIPLRVDIQIENDELYISNAVGKLFEYTPSDTESALVQKALFEEKQRLIENCLFGVDINPNSVKICRLRLWIELLKNAYYTEEKQLHTLPNIDINIKCGDSLISRFDLQDDLKDAFKDKEVKYNFTDYKKAVSDYKKSNSKKRKFEVLDIINEIKNNFQSTLDNKIKDKVSKAIGEYENEENRLNNLALFEEKIKKTEKDNLKKLKEKAENLRKEKDEIVNNAIYKNAFEWRFEFPEVLDDKGNYIGFDVILGNPPYGVSIKGKEREFLVNNLSKVPDYEIYYWFIDKSHKILKENGVVSYIIPNTILFNVFAQNYRLELFEKWNINEILDCTDINIFEDATVRNIIFQFVKNENNDKLVYRQTNDLVSFNELVSRENQVIHKNLIEKNNQNWGLIFKLSKEKISVVNKIKTDTKCLIDLFPETSQGLIAYDKYKGQSEETIKNRIFHTTIKSNPNHKKWLYGEDVVRYSVKWNEKEYVEYCDGIANPRDPKYFFGKRILIREITNPRIYASLTEEELYNDPSVLIIKDNTNNEYSLEVLLSILNSKLATFYHFNSSPKATKGSFPKILVYDINNFPLPNNINTEAKLELEKYCNNILEIKNCDSLTNTIDLDKKIDAIVYELYGLTEEEIEIVEGREINTLETNLISL
nr:TaqI-like C-terminal specificity domain-containing protein [uncultured Flavobacterium sp.]